MNYDRNQIARERAEAATHNLFDSLKARGLDVSRGMHTARTVLVTRGQDKIYLEPRPVQRNFRYTGAVTLTLDSEGQSRTFTYNTEKGWNVATIVKRLEAEFRHRVGERQDRELRAELSAKREARKQALVDAGLMRGTYDPNVSVYADGSGRVKVNLKPEQLEDFLREMKERGLI